MTEQKMQEEFSRKFKEIGVAEFFRKNLHMLGYSGPIKSFTTIIHEYVTNALDACEEYGILPKLTIQIRDIGDSRYIVAVEDNGPGIPAEYVPKVFGSMLAGTKFHRYIQSRGQQGIGAVGAILFGQMTTGKPTKVLSSTGDEIATLFLKIDIDRNQAKVIDSSKIKNDWRGTKLVTEFEGLSYRKGEQSPYEYLRRTAISNPHATIMLSSPTGEKIKWSRTISSVPKRPQEMQPHPYGVSADDLLRMSARSDASKLGIFLKKDLSRISAKRVAELAKISKLDMNMAPAQLSYSEAQKLVKAFKKVKLMAPPTDGLMPIMEQNLERSLQDRLESKFLRVRTRKPSVFRGGIPFQIEVAVSYGGSSGRKTDNGRKMEIMRFANKAPLLFDSGACGITQAIRTIDWKRYNLGDIDSAPVTVLVNIVSPHVPYTSTGKQAVADDPDIVSEIKLAVMEVARDLKRHLAGVAREKQKHKRKNIFAKYIPEVSLALSKLTSSSEKEITTDLENIMLKRLKIDTGEQDEPEKTQKTETEPIADAQKEDSA
ncbi:MAG: DNA topoisomerase VI subunit B [Candidatus Altiarchaeota archaeon]|nr:DNA topoisomerase VI subunit B [Candidatus Altiarchaeota archaeon]